MEKSDLSTEIASETDQIFQSEGDDEGEPYFPVDQDTLQPLSEILNRPHRTICGKFDEFKYN